MRRSLPSSRLARPSRAALRERRLRPSAAFAVARCCDRLPRTSQPRCARHESLTTRFLVRLQTESLGRCRSQQLVGRRSVRLGRMRNRSSSHISAAGAADREQRRSGHHNHHEVLEKIIRSAAGGRDDSRLRGGILSRHDRRREPADSSQQQPTSKHPLSKYSLHGCHRVRHLIRVAFNTSTKRQRVVDLTETRVTRWRVVLVTETTFR